MKKEEECGKSRKSKRSGAIEKRSVANLVARRTERRHLVNADPSKLQYVSVSTSISEVLGKGTKARGFVEATAKGSSRES